MWLVDAYLVLRIFLINDVLVDIPEQADDVICREDSIRRESVER